MKKIVLTTMMILGLVGCGTTCPSEPPRYAKYIEGGGHGMAYHFEIYDVQGDAQHTPSLRCTQYTYIKTDLYTDDLGNVNIDSIIWIDNYNNNAYPAEQKNQMKLYVSKSKIVVSGHTGAYSSLNGTYPIQ